MVDIDKLQEESIRQFENMVDYENSIEKGRERAEQHILNVWVEEGMLELDAIGVHWNNKHKVDMTSYKDKRFFNAIWHASTEILPALEVQVVIDGKNDCYVTTGSSGYVEFGMKPPVGMSLPIKCWIHTHPFGAAYFSGVDWGTVNVWKSLMHEAYVLGGVEHYGYWHNSKPDLLMIRYLDENGLETFRSQVQNRGEEE
jgi:hypothetical protein|tara:strand:+ start:253 stop:849 length:597 start_codon:yes stop_codon:yes gene_type:complete